MSASIPFSGNVFQEIFSVHFVLAPSVPLAIVSPCPLLSSRMGDTTIILSFLSLLPWYWPRWQLVILFFPLARPLLAPLFSLIVVWPFGMIAQFVYMLGETLCPLPDRAPLIASLSVPVTSAPVQSPP